MRAHNRGITLIELLAAITMLVILASTALPELQISTHRTAGETAITELARLIAKGRADAVNHGSLVSLCSLQQLTPAPKCRKGEWLSPLTLFIDRNGDSVLDGQDQILSERSLPAVAGSLLFRSFPAGRTALQFDALGFTNHQTGNFSWCADTGDAHTAHQLIFNNTGRTRLARDSDGDGIREGANGNNLICP